MSLERVKITDEDIQIEFNPEIEEDFKHFCIIIQHVQEDGLQLAESIKLLILEAVKHYKNWTEQGYIPISQAWLDDLTKNQKTERDNQNGHIVHLLDGYIKDLDFLSRVLKTSSIENREIIKQNTDDVLKRLYQIREAKP